MAVDPQIVALVNRMPELDVEAEAPKDAPKAKGKDAPDGKPKRKPPVTGKLTGPPWADAAAIYDAILAKGVPGVAAVIDMIQAVDDGTDYKARYTLAGLGAYVVRPGKEAARAAVIGALAAALGGDRPKTIQAFLIRQLQFVGDKGAVPALAKCLADADVGRDAVAALVAIRQGAAEALRAALPGAAGPNRLAILQALGVLKDAASLAAMKAAAADPDREIRLAAVWGLSQLADPSAVDVVIKASGADEWERIKAAQACLAMAENLLAAGRKADAVRIYTHLRDTRTDKSEAYLRDLAEKALAAK